MRGKKKLYLVYREVMATNIQKAAIERGTVYQIIEAKDQPETKKGIMGFNIKQNENKKSQCSDKEE